MAGKGRPRAFPTEEDFSNAVREYLEHCEGNGRYPNIAGFCSYNWITRETFYKQEEYYSDAFKKVQNLLEDAAINGNAKESIKIFYLKNKFGYKDKQEIESKNVNLNADYSELTDEELEKKAKELGIKV